jgi:hypothetical protein
MTDPTVVVPFVPRQGRKGRSDRTAGANRATAAERTSAHLARIAALLGMPVGVFFGEVPSRGATTPDPREVLELIHVFHRIGNADERRRILEIAQSALEGEEGIKSHPNA